MNDLERYINYSKAIIKIIEESQIPEKYKPIVLEKLLTPLYYWEEKEPLILDLSKYPELEFIDSNHIRLKEYVDAKRFSEISKYLNKAGFSYLGKDKGFEKK